MGIASPAVDYDRLTLGRVLGQGGQGKVWEVARTITPTGGRPWPTVFKEYGAMTQLDVAVLRAMVRLPSSSAPADRADFSCVCPGSTTGSSFGSQMSRSLWRPSISTDISDRTPRFACGPACLRCAPQVR
jgi:hypothetical protein